MLLSTLYLATLAILFAAATEAKQVQGSTVTSIVHSSIIPGLKTVEPPLIHPRKLEQATVSTTNSGGNSVTGNQTTAEIAFAKLQPLIKKLRNSSVYSTPLSTPVYIPSANNQMITLYMPVLSSLLDSMGDNATASTIRAILTGNSTSNKSDTSTASPTVKSSSGPSDSSSSQLGSPPAAAVDPISAYWQTLFNPPSSSGSAPATTSAPSASMAPPPSNIATGSRNPSVTPAVDQHTTSNPETSSASSPTNSGSEPGSTNKALIVALSVGLPCALIVGVLSAMLIIRWRTRAAAFKLVADGGGSSMGGGRGISRIPAMAAAAGTAPGISHVGVDEEIGDS